MSNSCASQNLHSLPTFDMRHENHVISYLSCSWLIQICTLHYILLSSLDIFSIYLKYLVGLYALPPYQPCIVAPLARWQYNTIQYNTIQYNTIHYSTLQYNTIQYNTIQYSTIQYDTIQYNTIQYNTIRYNTIQ